MNLFKSTANIVETLAVATETVLKSSANSIAGTAEVLEQMAQVSLDARKETHKDRVLLAKDSFYAEAGHELAENAKNKAKAEQVLGCTITEQFAKLREQYNIE